VLSDLKRFCFCDGFPQDFVFVVGFRRSSVSSAASVKAARKVAVKGQIFLDNFHVYVKCLDLVLLKSEVGSKLCAIRQICRFWRILDRQLALASAGGRQALRHFTTTAEANDHQARYRRIRQGKTRIRPGSCARES